MIAAIIVKTIITRVIINLVFLLKLGFKNTRGKAKGPIHKNAIIKPKGV